MTQSHRKLFLGPPTGLRCHHLEGRGSSRGPGAAGSDPAPTGAGAMGISPEPGEHSTVQPSRLRIRKAPSEP